MNEKDIFVAALQRSDEAARAAYLDDACGSEVALRQRVEALLREHARLGSFIESPAPALMGAGIPAEATMPSAGVRLATATELEATGIQLEGGVLGDYRILREVGRGGMGVVYEAEQISLQRRVALKVLPFASVLDKNQAVRFKNEARAAASLDHPHVVHVYAVGVERGVHYYAMQFVDGQTVADLIAAERRYRGIADKTAADSPKGSSGYEPTEAHQVGDDLSSSRFASRQDTAQVARLSASTWRDSDEKERIDSVVKLLIQAAEAIEHAHRMGIVHRDIKPSNLLADAERHLWVADFGLAMVEAEGNLTTSGSMLGTLRYMSPEQIRGDRHVLDHHTDIYSLGATLYEMLTLQPAFPDSDVTRLMQRVTHDEPTSPRKVNSAISRDLETIVLKAMAKEPQSRYATAGEMAADLRRFVTDEPIHAKPPSTFERSRKWGRRHRSIVRAVAATVTIAIVVAGGLLWHERSQTLAAFAAEKQHRRTAQQKEAEARRQALRASRAEDLAEKQADLADQQRQLAISQKEEAVRNVYVAQMRLVMDEWNSGQILRLDTMLGRYLPQPGEQDLRGWEWYYALSLAHSELMTLQTDGDDMRAVAWSADGRYLASAGKSGLIKVWEADSGRELSTLTGHTGTVKTLAFSPDSRRLASVSNDDTTRIWSLQEGRATTTLDSDTNNALSTVAWSPDGTRLASGTADGFVRVRDTTTWQVLRELQGHSGGVNSVCWSPDGSRVVSGGEDGTVKIWDVTTGEAVRNLVPPLRGAVESSSHGPVTSLAWGPDGEHLASSSLWPCVCICIWDVASGEVTAKLDSGIGYRNAVAWSPDGKRLALGSDNNFVRIWEPAKGEPPHRICGHTGIVWSVAWSPDGRRLASCSQDTTVKIWDTQLDAEAHSLPYDGTASQRILAWSPDGKRLAVPGKDDHSLRVMDTATRQETLALHAGDERIVSATWSPDSQLLACGNDDGTIGIWDVQQGIQVRTLRGHTQRVGSVAWSPDGLYLASGSDDTTAKIWSLAAGKERFTLRWQNDEVDAVAWSPDGRHLACAPRGSSVTIWDTSTGQRQLTLVPQGWSYSFFGSVSWSGDGRQIASAGHTGQIEVWDSMTGKRLACLRGHLGSQNANVAWHPNGIRVASGGWDGTVQVWDPARQQELLSFSGFFPVAWSPDGKQLAHAGADSTIKIRDASIGYRIAETPGYRLELARHFSALGEHARAAAVYALLVADYPDVREYQNLRQTETARVLIEEEKLDEATAILHELITRIPPPPRPPDKTSTEGGGPAVVENEKEKRVAALLQVLAAAYFRRGEFDAALREGELVCKLAPNRAEAFNLLAWWLATCPDIAHQDPSEAFKLAARAVDLAPEQGTLWNTLGVAQYRAANFKAALNSLNKSLELEPSGSSLPYNAFFLAMAHWQLGEQEEARRWFHRAADWIVTNNLDDEELSRFRSEAETLLRVNPEEQKTGEKDNPLGDSAPVNGSSDRE